MQNNENALRAISLVLDNTTAFGMALSLALIPLCLTYFAHRARSVLFLRDRLWRFIGGKSEFYAEEFEAIRKESRDLEHFRMEFRVPTESTTDAKNFLQWQKQSQISIRKISLAHEYIDWKSFSNPKIKGNLKLQSLKFSFCAIMLMLFSSIAISITAFPYAIVSFPDTSIFYLKPHEFKLSLFNPPIGKETCKEETLLKQENIPVNFPPNRIIEMCQAISTPDDEDKIEQLFRNQRVGGIILFSISTIFLLFSIYENIKISTAKEINNVLRKLAIETPVATPDNND